MFLESGALIQIYESVYLIYICLSNISRTFPKRKTMPCMFVLKHPPLIDAVLVESINFYLTRV